MRADEIQKDAQTLFARARGNYLWCAQRGEHDSYAYAQMATIALLGLAPMADVEAVADEGRAIMNARYEDMLRQLDEATQ